MNITCTEAYYKSCNGVNMVRALVWEPEGVTPKGIVQIAHGLSEHIGRYDEFARFLAENGYIVCGNDHLGHGKTVAGIADLGFVYNDDHVNMIRDLNTLNRIMAKKYPDVPYFIMGHSMGSLMARIYTANFFENLCGSVFVGTTQLPPALLAVSDPVDAILERLSSNSSSGNIGFDLVGFLERKALKDDDELAWVSKSLENRENYRADPLVGFEAGNTLTREMIKLAVKASLRKTAEVLPSDYPVLFIAGAKDPIGLFGKAVINAVDMYQKAGLEPEVFLYPGARHEVLNEDERERTYADILAFFNKSVEKC